MTSAPQLDLYELPANESVRKDGDSEIPPQLSAPNARTPFMGSVPRFEFFSDLSED